MSEILLPDAAIIKKHLDFITEGCSSYDDGLIEISFLKGSNLFSFDNIDGAAKKTIEINNNKGAYLCGSFLLPETAPFGRCNDDDFYGSSVIWCDIDEEHNTEELKKLYKHMPPSRAVVTARTPHRRIHLWWKLKEPVACADTLRDALRGVQQALGGDPMVTNPTSLMRIAGTINHPSEKKKLEGRINEFVEYIEIPNSQPVYIEDFLKAYPVKDYTVMPLPSQAIITKVAQTKSALDVQEHVADGRDAYASQMICASIINLTAQHGRWPEPQEVFNDVWPTYSTKVSVRGSSLEQDGRGQKFIVQKINSKLRLFVNGGMKRYGLGSVQDIVKNQVTKESTASAFLSVDSSKLAEVVDPETGEVIEETGGLYYNHAKDVQPCFDVSDFVQGTLTDGALSVVYGESNCGKTFFASDLAFHVVTGSPWRGKRIEKGNVLYVSMEGAYGLNNRVFAYKKETGETLDGLLIMPCTVDFVNPEGNIYEFVNVLEKAKQDVGDIKLIIIDTLARAVGGGDENSGQDMGMLVRHADIICRHTGAHILFVHHSGKDKAKGARGHSSLRAAVDTEIEISRNEGDIYSNVKFSKQRDMEMEQDIQFSLKRVVLGSNKYGDEISSCVVIPYEGALTKERYTLTPLQTFIYESLIRALDTYGKERYLPHGRQKCVTYDELREILEERGYKELMETENKTTEQQIKSSTQTARIALQKYNKISFNKLYVWTINNEE